MDISGEQLLEVFANYNAQIWPMQIVAYVLGVVCVLFAFRKAKWAARIVLGVLSFFWFWVALMFWLPSASQGFSIGYAFIALFLVEGVLLIIQTVKPKLAFGTSSSGDTIAGLIMILYAMVGYPLFGMLIGHVYPQTPPFGLTPCPLIIFTFGIFLLAKTKIPLLLLAIPFFYGLSGVIWVSKGIWEDLGMVLTSLVAGYLILVRNQQLTREPDISEMSRDSAAWSLDISETGKR